MAINGQCSGSSGGKPETARATGRFTGHTCGFCQSRADRWARRWLSNASKAHQTQLSILAPRLMQCRRFGSDTSALGTIPHSLFGPTLSSSLFNFASTLSVYRLPPSSHVAQCGAHPASAPLPGRSSVRNSITSPAVQPPRMAVTVKYILSLAAAVIARSTPPGIADSLSDKYQQRVAIIVASKNPPRLTDSWQYCK